MKYTEKYGQPQGNEFLYGNYILRQVEHKKETQFWIVDQFDTVKKACEIYRAWISENPEAFQSTWRKIVLANNQHYLCGCDHSQIIIDDMIDTRENPDDTY
jgi:hypothetical protein